MPVLPPIPGYAEAVQKERQLRDAAFLDVPEQIAGVTVQSLTIDRLIILDEVKSPFTTASTEITPEQIAIFLWIVSPEFRPFSDEPEQRKKDQAVHRRYIKSLRKVNFTKVLEDIDAYLEAAFFDAPGGKSTRISYCSWVATLLCVVCEKTHWSPEKVRATPLKQLWQFLRAGTTGPQFNPLSDKVRSDWLDKLNSGQISLPSPL